ncbi:protein of unknown function [Pseudomonas sp. JV551A1]|nr:protein of unknown function [Pseudomonas sp. JV551A1]
MSEPLSGITYKLVVLLKAREGVSLDTFADAWLALEARAPIVGDGLVRAVFARPLSGPSPIANASTAPYDAALETWWQREDDAFGWASSRDFEQRWLPQRLALLAGPPAAIGGAAADDLGARATGRAGPGHGVGIACRTAKYGVPRVRRALDRAACTIGAWGSARRGATGSARGYPVGCSAAGI